MEKVALQNLGCSKNQIDGERILHLFSSSGYELTTDFTIADIIIVNTCAFIKEAQEEAIESILELAAYKKEGTCRLLVVSGCFSQRYRNEVVKEFPEVDLWVGVDDWEALIGQRFNTSTASYKRALTEPIATQYIKIAEGCSHGCTFCVIPSIRGPFKSRATESIIEEARWLRSEKVQELILVAQDSSFYGRDKGDSLAHLLRELLDKTDFPWIRTMYLHPQFVSDELLATIASDKRICPYFDMPIQHISDPVLKAMNRTPLSGEIRSLIDKIRTRIPDAGIRTAFITGFPGETEKDFQTLVRFVEEMEFDKMGVFPYSPEEGTKAVSMPHRPRSSTVSRRCEELMLVQREISRSILEKKIGSTIEVIVDGVSDDPDFNYEARTRIDAPEIDGKVYIDRGDLVIGSICNVRITGAGDYDFYAEA